MNYDSVKNFLNFINLSFKQAKTLSKSSSIENKSPKVAPLMFSAFLKLSHEVYQLQRKSSLKAYYLEYVKRKDIYLIIQILQRFT